MTGQLVMRQAGTVLDGIDLVGDVVVAADNVTIRRSRITAPASLPDQGRGSFAVVSQFRSVRGLLLDDCEVDGAGIFYRTVMASRKVTVRKCELRRTGHGVEVGGDYTIEDNRIHSTTAGPDGDWHVHGVISSGGRNETGAPADVEPQWD